MVLRLVCSLLHPRRVWYLKFTTMMTAALIEDHRAMNAEFDRIEQVLPGLQQSAAVKQLVHQVEDLLRKHAAAEEDLFLLVLGRHPEHKHALGEVYREHQEIDGRLINASATLETAQARQWLREAIARSRRHFQHEESEVFPLIERVSDPATLLKLGRIWRQQRRGAAPWAE